MPQPISLDLRQRATQAYLDGEGTQAEIAQRFRISKRSLGSWLALLQAGESLHPLPHSGGAIHVKLRPEHKLALLSWVQEQCDLTGAELAAKLWDEFALGLDPSQITRKLNEWGWTRKKKRWVMSVKADPMSEHAGCGGRGGPR